LLNAQGFLGESPYTDLLCVCDDKNSIPLIETEKNIIKNKSDNFGTEGYRKNERAHTQDSKDPCTPYSEQNKIGSPYFDQNTTGKILLNKWRFMELTHVFDPKAPKQGHIYTVALKMVPYNLVVDNQRWSYSIDPDNSPIRRVRGPFTLYREYSKRNSRANGVKLYTYCLGFLYRALVC
jgi:hypothetical protein